jgi:hypothetical protein
VGGQEALSQDPTPGGWDAGCRLPSNRLRRLIHCDLMLGPVTKGKRFVEPSGERGGTPLVRGVDSSSLSDRSS